MSIFRVSVLILISVTILSAAQNNLIQPLAELQKDLKGKLERITVHAKSLEGNLEGDSPDRDVFVYLPPGYERESGRHYPVVYTLHGYGLHAQQWVGFANVAGLEKGLAAWSANPNNAPLFIDLPSKDGKQRPEIAAKWMANSLMVMLQEYAPNLKKMKAIEMNVGLQDALLQTNRDMDVALTEAGVAHHFETFEGDHNGQVPMNFQMKVLPFFSRELKF